MDNEQRKNLDQKPVPSRTTNALTAAGIMAALSAGIFAGIFVAYNKIRKITFTRREVTAIALEWGIFGLITSIFSASKDDTQHSKPSAVAKNTASALTFGALSGASAAIFGAWGKKTKIDSKKTLNFAAWAGGIFTALHLLLRKSNPAFTESPTIPPQTPLPPTEQGRPQQLQLANIPQILDILVAKGELTSEQQATVLTQIKQGGKGFAGELAVSNGFVPQAQIDAALTDQAARKAEAALIDIATISQHGTMPAPAFLRANWGNNNVNPTSHHPTRTDGASAAANIAQNLVMLANANPAPELLPTLRNGVLAASNLARGIAQGDSAQVPLAKMAASWEHTVSEAVTLAAKANPQLMTDASGKPVDVKQFLDARTSELTAGVQQALQHPPQRGTSHER